MCGNCTRHPPGARAILTSGIAAAPAMLFCGFALVITSSNLLRHVFSWSNVARLSRAIVSVAMSDITSTVVPPFEEIGGCRLLHQVGQGGMGVVFAAEHLALKRRVAIKLLPESKADDEHVQRFIEEARTCARIQHPNVVPIHNVGYDRGRYFIERSNPLQRLTGSRRDC
jgi:Protein kinase domain